MPPPMLLSSGVNIRQNFQRWLPALINTEGHDQVSLNPQLPKERIPRINDKQLHAILEQLV